MARDERLEVRMSSAELKAVDRLAQSKEIKRSEVIRNLVAKEVKKIK